MMPPRLMPRRDPSFAGRPHPASPRRREPTLENSFQGGSRALETQTRTSRFTPWCYSRLAAIFFSCFLLCSRWAKLDSDAGLVEGLLPLVDAQPQRKKTQISHFSDGGTRNRGRDPRGHFSLVFFSFHKEIEIQAIYDPLCRSGLAPIGRRRCDA